MPDAKPVWCETWKAECQNWPTMFRVDANETIAKFGPVVDPVHDDRARLAAAAPALVRALLAVEWSEREIRTDNYIIIRIHCPMCQRHDCGWSEETPRHEPGCILDAALTAAGLPPNERDAARERMTGR